MFALRGSVVKDVAPVPVVEGAAPPPGHTKVLPYVTPLGHTKVLQPIDNVHALMHEAMKEHSCTAAPVVRTALYDVATSAATADASDDESLLPLIDAESEDQLDEVPKPTEPTEDQKQEFEEAFDRWLMEAVVMNVDDKLPWFIDDSAGYHTSHLTRGVCGV